MRSITKRLGGRLSCFAWLAVLLSPNALAAPWLERIEQSQTLQVCIWPDYYAISYRDPRTSELQGFDIDMARDLAQRLKVKLEFVDTDFSRFIADLKAERCAVAMFGIAQTAQRARDVSFTVPTLVGGIYAITNQAQGALRRWTDIDQPGVVVAVQAGTYMEPVMRDYLKHAELSVVRAPNTREEEVRAGRADVFMTDYPYSQRMLAQHDWARLITPEQPVSPLPYGYAIMPGDQAWLDYLNQFIAEQQANGRLRAIAQRHRLEPIIAKP